MIDNLNEVSYISNSYDFEPLSDTKDDSGAESIFCASSESDKKCLSQISEIIEYRALRPFSTIFIFMGNHNELANQHSDKRQDKYYHARANAQAGQHFDIVTPLLLSVGREIWDMIRKNIWDKNPNTSFEYVLNDSITDLQADIYGLAQGLLHPFSDVDSILDEDYLNSLCS